MKQKPQEKNTIIVIGEEPRKPFPMTRLDREKCRVKDKGRDHYYL